MSFMKTFLSGLARNNLSWFMLQPLARIGNFLMQSRNQMIYDEERRQAVSAMNAKFKHVVDDRVVLHGPFKGLRYPALMAMGSALYPKLVGSYEREIHPIIEEICNTRYSEIVNIGCAEGYYAVGLAMRIPTAKVEAFDIEPEARMLTGEMAKVNGLEARLTIRSLCTEETLRDFQFTGKGLVVCDCEGYERQLFTPASRANLAHCDLLIETHDFVDIHITQYLTALFANTHDLRVVKSIDDIEKAKTYPYAEAAALALPDRQQLFREGRPAIMEWFFLTPKQQ